MTRLSSLVGQVLRDLDPRGAYAPIVTYLPGDLEGHTEVMIKDDSGMGCGFTVENSGSDKDVLFVLADRIPDAFVELYHVGVPLVPRTQRPATPAIVDGVVIWQDPAGASAWSCPVGQYEG